MSDKSRITPRRSPVGGFILGDRIDRRAGHHNEHDRGHLPGRSQEAVAISCCDFCKGQAVIEQQLRMWRRDSEPLYGIQSNRQLCVGHARQINDGERLWIPNVGDPHKDMLFQKQDQQAFQRKHDIAVAEIEARYTYRIQFHTRHMQERTAQRETYCWGCKTTLSSALHEPCRRCHWLTCPNCTSCSWYCK